MHLVSLAGQQVRIGDAEFRFRAGETIHTENSYKYDLAELKSRAARCGLRTDDVWTDGAGTTSRCSVSPAFEQKETHRSRKRKRRGAQSFRRLRFRLGIGAREAE